MRLARVFAVLVAATTATLAVLTAVFMLARHLPGESPLDVVILGPMLVMTGMAVVVATRRPRNTVGWLMLGLASLLVAQGFVQRYAHYVYDTHSTLPAARYAAWFGTWCFIPALGFLVLIFLLFPTGHSLSPRWRPITAIAVAFVPFSALAALPSIRDDGRVLLHAPSTGQIPHAGVLTIFAEPIFNGLLAVSVVVLVVRWIRSRDVERQQMKLFVYGAVIFALAVVTVIAAGQLFHTDDPTSTPLGGAALLIGFSSIALAIGLGVLRYRLYDIDRIISRTVGYLIVSGVVGAIFVAVALVPTALVGSGQVPSWLIALGTLVAVFVFRPIQRRVQRVVDRRFNRRRYDASVTIDAFASRLRDDVDLNTLQVEVADVVRRTMQPRHVSLWLRP